MVAVQVWMREAIVGEPPWLCTWEDSGSLRQGPEWLCRHLKGDSLASTPGGPSPAEETHTCAWLHGYTVVIRKKEKGNGIYTYLHGYTVEKKAKPSGTAHEGIYIGPV